MRARVRWMGVCAGFACVTGCAETLTIGGMGGDAPPPDAMAPPDVVTSPDATIALDSMAPPPDATTALDAMPPPDATTALDAMAAPDVVASHDATPTTDVSAPLDAADGGTFPPGWCTSGERCYADPDAIQASYGGGPWLYACDLPGSRRLLVGADDEAVTVPLPFPLRYVNRTYTQVGISSNGVIGFPTVLADPVNRPLPYRPMGDAVFPFWQDLRQPMGVCVATVGDAPARKFVIHYPRAEFGAAGSPSWIAFEVVIDEGTGAVHVHPGSLHPPVGDPTIGYQELGGDHYQHPVTTDSATLAAVDFSLTTRVTEGVGVCRAGVAACGASGGTCAGQVTPTDETCNGLDDDCDGVVDDCATCGPSRVCTGGRCVCPPGLACDGAAVAGVTLGAAHTCAWRVDGTVACWGSGGSGQLGDGCSVSRSTPTAVPGLRDVVEVSAGQNHTCARRRDGTVACWGSNRYGQLGDGTMTDRASPVDVPGLTDAAALYVGGDDACVIRAGGATVCWGSNLTAQVGDGTSAHRASPTPVMNLPDATSLAVEFGQSCALRAGGSVACWGGNRWGAVGDGTDTTYVYTPTTVVDLARATQVAVSGGASFARRDDGTLLMWGFNVDGFIPDMPTNAEIRRPVAMTAFGRVARFAVVGGTAYGYRDDGTVLVQGLNNYGQAGDGTTTARPTPTAAPHLSGLRLGVGNAGHTCGVRGDGSLWCWGNNNAGQVGDGTTVMRLAPVRVAL